MAQREWVGQVLFVTGCLAFSTYFARQMTQQGDAFFRDGLFRGLFHHAHARETSSAGKKIPYALSKATMVERILELIRDEYVDPKRVVPRELFFSALNGIQRDVAQVLVQVDSGGQSVRLRVEEAELSIKVDDIKGPWDVLARLRKVFAFLEQNLKDSPDIELRDIEYTACNGMLHTLDPHSVLFTPEAFKDFNVGTSGKFGGLGIVIGMRDKQLTVMSTMPGTPAALSGLQKGDRIRQINQEATTTMGINEAVQRLRGDPKTDVVLHVHREGKDGWPNTREFKLTREEIRVASVKSKGLEDGIGYVRLKHFSERSTNELSAALSELHATGHKNGLIFDLRGNPGGLLDQAKKISDLFIKEGVIVVSDGRREGRDEQRAVDDGTEPTYPIVVLINSSSASASEIVAGALKNLDRAIIIGETSFGKGSVQKVLRKIPPEGAALKLTIAQYLTPGDVSIQSVGITPDIELSPMTVDLQELDLRADTHGMRERDLSGHLSNAKAKEGARPLETVRFYLSREERFSIRERGGDPDEEFYKDFQIAFAQRFLKAAGTNSDKRTELIRRAKSMLDTSRSEENKKLSDELAKHGVEWIDEGSSSNAGFDSSKIKVAVEPSKPEAQVTAGEPLELKVTVTNEGTVPLYRLRAFTKSDAGIFDGKEFVFGYVAPGKSRSWTTPLGWCETDGHKLGSSTPAPKDAPRVCRIPKDTVSRADAIKIRFEEAHDHIPQEALIKTQVKALPRPSFAYTYQVADDGDGNGDGQLQVREKASIYLSVKNTGEARSYETEATIHNLSGDALLLRDARFDLSNMQPGETRKVRFTFDVQPTKEKEVKVQLAIRDQDLRENASERIVIPLREPISIAESQGIFAATGEPIPLFEQPSLSVKPFATLDKGATVSVTGAHSEFVRVLLDKTRFAFAPVRKGQLQKSKTALSSTWTEIFSHSPPAIVVDALELVTQSDKAKLKGYAVDQDRLLDMYVFVGSRKVYYKSNRNGADPKKLPFEIDLPLRPGTNYVSVWARENSDNLKRKVYLIRRDGADGSILEAPKSSDSNSVEEMLSGSEKD